MDARTYFYITRKPRKGFMCMLTLGEVHDRLTAGELKDDCYAAESDGRSFNEFKRSGVGNWRTLAELFREQSVQDALARRGSPSSTSQTQPALQRPPESLWPKLLAGLVTLGFFAWGVYTRIE